MSKNKNSNSTFKAFSTLADKSDNTYPNEVYVEVEHGNNSIYISPVGYGDASSVNGEGCPVMLEVWEGQLRVVIWADINQEDPTHIISLEGARENLRDIGEKAETAETAETAVMSNNELDKIRRDKIDEIWEDYDLGLPEDYEFADSDGWETIQPGNDYWRTFYYYPNPEGDGPSAKAVFSIQFKTGSVTEYSVDVSYY